MIEYDLAFWEHDCVFRVRRIVKEFLNHNMIAY